MKIRSDISRSHDRVWQHMASPGIWLAGSERVAVAAEVRAARNCELCRTRKSALSANAVSGEHAPSAIPMSEARIELIHKLVTDPGRITHGWVKALLDSGMRDVEYVEIAGLASATMVVDTFHVWVHAP